MQKSIYSAEQERVRRFLIEMRRKARLTQRALAERLDRERSFVARLELGERRIDLIEFRRYCEACGASAPREARRLMIELDGISEHST